MCAVYAVCAVCAVYAAFWKGGVWRGYNQSSSHSLLASGGSAPVVCVVDRYSQRVVRPPQHSKAAAAAAAAGGGSSSRIPVFTAESVEDGEVTLSGSTQVYSGSYGCAHFSKLVVTAAPGTVARVSFTTSTGVCAGSDVSMCFTFVPCVY